MGCINSSPVVIIHSINSFKKEAKKNLEQKKIKNPAINVFTFADEDNDNFHSSLEQSQIPITAKMESNELIFL